MPKQAFLTCSCGQKITITPSKRIQEIYDFSVKCACGINYGLMVWPHRLAEGVMSRCFPPPGKSGRRGRLISCLAVIQAGQG